MVVAGRVTETGDVAIMMVEAESTEATWEKVQAGAQAPTEEIVAEGLEASKAFIKQLCRGAGRARARSPPSRSTEFPRFLDYQDDAFAAVEARASAATSPRR